MTDALPALLAAVAITDRLRSPGGCPWDAAQTHDSLSRYLLEESYETLDAIQSGDLSALREELGDLLFQVLFHARIAEEADVAVRFSISDVAADLVDKLTRRHPHVFADVNVSGADDVETNWDAIKRTEKKRSSVTEGIPLAQPALSLTAALIRRSAKAGVVVPASEASATATPDGAVSSGSSPGPSYGDRLFDLAREAVEAGVDPELALRQRATAFAAALRQAEGAAPRAASAE